MLLHIDSAVRIYYKYSLLPPSSYTWESVPYSHQRSSINRERHQNDLVGSWMCSLYIFGPWQSFPREMTFLPNRGLPEQPVECSNQLWSAVDSKFQTPVQTLLWLFANFVPAAHLKKVFHIPKPFLSHPAARLSKTDNKVHRAGTEIPPQNQNRGVGLSSCNGHKALSRGEETVRTIV